VSAFFRVVLSCVGRGVAFGRSPFRGVLLNVQNRFINFRNCSTPEQATMAYLKADDDDDKNYL
jgi:hypothetical protein